MKIKSQYLALALIFVFCVFSQYDIFVKLENYVEDSQFQKQKDPDSEIVILGIDEKSLEEFGTFPWDRKVYSELFDILSKGKPAAIGVDILFSDKSASPESDLALITSIKNVGNVVLASYGNIESTSYENVEIKYNKDIRNIEVDTIEEPMGELKGVSRNGFINVFPSDKDGEIIRRFYDTIDYDGKKINSFSYEIYKEAVANGLNSGKLLAKPEEIWNKNYIDFSGDPGTFEYHSIADVFDNTIDPSYFEGKIVLIGPYTVGLQDRFFTAASKETQMYGIEIHANLIQNYLYNNFKSYASDTVNLFILIILGIASYLLFKKLTPPKASVLLIVLMGLYLVFANFTYSKGILIKIVYPLLLMASINLMLIIYSYIDEYIERRKITDTFGKYVAPQVVDQILKGGEKSLNLGGVRRFITVLFVDIRGFTPLSEKAQPEEIVEILNDYLNLTAESIFNEGGTLDKFIGDATMAIYNAPLDLEDHAYRAVKSAWAMKQGSIALQEKLEKKFGKSVQFGIGINTGYAVVGNIGAKFRMDYTAIGDTVNTSARLESNAKAGQILLSKSTYELVKGKVEVTPLGEIKVKGKDNGVEIYQLEKVI